MFATAWQSAVAPIVLALQQRPVKLLDGPERRYG
jgi:hypothetical protein